jgi:hypothetical protein
MLPAKRLWCFSVSTEPALVDLLGVYELAALFACEFPKHPFPLSNAIFECKWKTLIKQCFNYDFPLSRPSLTNRVENILKTIS